jgi:hypothetical protein
MSSQPIFVWSVSGGRKVNSETGLFKAKRVAGEWVIQAAGGGTSGTAIVRVHKEV